MQIIKDNQALSCQNIQWELSIINLCPYPQLTIIIPTKITITIVV